MALKYQILPERNLIVFTVDGSVTIEDFFETWDKVLADEEFIRGMGSLWDVRNGSFTAITSDHLYSVGDAILRDIDRRGDNYKVAFVVQGQLDYGVARIFQAISQKLPCETEIFRDYDEAMGYVSA